MAARASAFARIRIGEVHVANARAGGVGQRLEREAVTRGLRGIQAQLHAGMAHVVQERGHFLGRVHPGIRLVRQTEGDAGFLRRAAVGAHVVGGSRGGRSRGAARWQ